MRTDTPAPAPVDEPDSVRLVLEFAREQYARIDTRHESLVSRSIAFLGVLAVLVGLAAAAPFQGAVWRACSVLGIVIFLVAIVLFITVTRLRTYTATPEVSALIDGYVHRPEAETRRQVLSNMREAVRMNDATVRRVGRTYQWAATLAGAGTVAIGVGVVAALLSK